MSKQIQDLLGVANSLLNRNFEKDELWFNRGKYNYPDSVCAVTCYKDKYGKDVIGVYGKLIIQNRKEFYEEHRKGPQTALGNLVEIAVATVNKRVPEFHKLHVFNSLVAQLSGIKLNPAPPQEFPSKNVFFDWRYGPGYFTLYANDEHTLSSANEISRKRLVLTPSYLRSNLKPNTFLKDGQSAIWGNEASDTLHIIVTRRYEARAYAQNFCPLGFIVAAMPENEEGVGSARFWCMELARVLNFDWIWMLDDTLEPSSNAVYNRATKQRESLLSGVQLCETLKNSLMKELHSKIGIISLRRFRSDFGSKQDITTSFCQGFLLLHRKAIDSSQIYFWRGLYYGEDLIFSQECIKKKLCTLRINSHHYCKLNNDDDGIEGTGAQEKRAVENDAGFPDMSYYVEPIVRVEAVVNVENLFGGLNVEELKVDFEQNVDVAGKELGVGEPVNMTTMHLLYYSGGVGKEMVEGEMAVASVTASSSVDDTDAPEEKPR